MHLTHLSLRDFRSYASAELPLEPGITVLVGPNGVGKTNIVEAIGYLAMQDSHRVGNDAPLVRFGAERALIGVGLRRGSQDASVEIEQLAGAPGLEASEQAAVTQLVRALTRDDAVRKVAYGTEAGLFQGAGIATVVCGPGSIEQAHKPDEYVEKDQLAQCEQFLRQLARSL